jgi:hypothetical protein
MSENVTEEQEFAQFAAKMTAGEPDTEQKKPDEEPTEAPAADPELAPDAEPAKEPTEAPPKVEAKPEPPKEPEKKTDWTAALAKEKEKRQAKIAAKLAADKQASDLAAAQAKAAQLDEIMQLSKEKRLAALEKLGMTVDDVNTEYIRDIEQNPNKPPPYVSALEKKLEEQTAMLKQIAEREAQREAQAIEARRAETLREIENSVGEAIKTKADDFELLSRHKQGKEIVINLLAAHHEATGEVLSIEQACSKVEAFLLEDLKPFTETKKFRSATQKSTDTPTISGDMRQSEPRGASGSDEDTEFLKTGLRLLTQAG